MIIFLDGDFKWFLLPVASTWFIFRSIISISFFFVQVFSGGVSVGIVLTMPTILSVWLCIAASTDS